VGILTKIRKQRDGTKISNTDVKSLLKIQNYEFAVIFAGGVVISASGFDLIVEITESFLLSVKRYKRRPFSITLVPG